MRKSSSLKGYIATTHVGRVSTFEHTRLIGPKCGAIGNIMGNPKKWELDGKTLGTQKIINKTLKLRLLQWLCTHSFLSP